MTKAQTKVLAMLTSIALAFYIIGSLSQEIRSLVLVIVVFIIFGRIYKWSYTTHILQIMLSM